MLELLQIDYFERLVASTSPPKKSSGRWRTVQRQQTCFWTEGNRPQNSYESTLEYPRFSDGAATNRHFRFECYRKNPQKISKSAKAAFLGRKKIWIHVNPITEQKVTWSPTASVWRGGSPSPILLTLVNYQSTWRNASCHWTFRWSIFTDLIPLIQS